MVTIVTRMGRIGAAFVVVIGMRVRTFVVAIVRCRVNHARRHPCENAEAEEEAGDERHGSLLVQVYQCGKEFFRGCCRAARRRRRNEVNSGNWEVDGLGRK